MFYKYSTRNSKTDNGFRRNINMKKAVVNRITELDNDTYSIFEITPEFIMLYQFRKPNEQLKISIGLDKQIPLHLNDPQENDKMYKGWNSVGEIGNSVYILTGQSSSAYKISGGQEKPEHFQLDSVPFYQSQVINSNSFLIRSRTKVNGVNRRKLKIVNNQGNELCNYIPEMQVDGYFCNDGTFQYDKFSNRVVYMFYYRGEFSCLDTNLKVLYKAKTIDTVRKAKIHLKKIGEMVTMDAIPKFVNKRISIANNKLYLNSAVKADNESTSLFANNDVIDVYDLQNGKYSASFYIPTIRNQKLTEFKVFNQTLIALYNKTLVVFKIPPFDVF